MGDKLRAKGVIINASQSTSLQEIIKLLNFLKIYPPWQNQSSTALIVPAPSIFQHQLHFFFRIGKWKPRNNSNPIHGIDMKI
jgi:hypothetical protein